MSNLPDHIVDHINDYRFGSALEWKRSFEHVASDMVGWLFYFKEDYEDVHYLDVDNDNELIDFIRGSTLMQLRPNLFVHQVVS